MDEVPEEDRFGFAMFKVRDIRVVSVYVARVDRITTSCNRPLQQHPASQQLPSRFVLWSDIAIGSCV